MHAICGRASFRCRKILDQQTAVMASMKVRMNLHTNSLSKCQTKLEMKPFWKLRAVLNNVSVALSSNAEEDYYLTSPSAQTQKGLCVEYDHQSQVVTVTKDDSVQSELSMSLPYKVDFDMKLNGYGHATIGNVENVAVNIEADSYDIDLEELKSNEINVVTNKGDIQCNKTLKGNVTLVACHGNINTRKIQGHNVSVNAESGYVTLGDVYAEQLWLYAGQEAQLKSAHGTSRLQSHGGLLLGTAEGDLSLSSRFGDIDVHLADRARVVEITAGQGNIRVSYSPGVNGKFGVDARSLEYVDSGLIKITESGQTREDCLRFTIGDRDGLTDVTAKSPKGAISLRQRTWLEAISAFNRMLMSSR